MIKKAILLTLLLSQPTLALSLEDKAKDYMVWLNNNETKTITIRIGNYAAWTRIKANNILLDELNGIYFTESGKRRFYHGPFLVEE